MRGDPTGVDADGWRESTALLTDQYEIGNLQGALHSNIAHRRSVFEVFARRLPAGRKYGVCCGLGRVLEALAAFRFTDRHLRWLEVNGIADSRTRAVLRDQVFTGDLWAYPEGELYFPGSPVLRVEAPFSEGILLETLFLGILNWDSGIASTASRMYTSARGRSLLEMGSRRTHEAAAVATARAAYIAGFDATSNMEAGFRYGIPVRGTAAHAFTLAHPDEFSAFRAQVATQGPGTTLLVDTYDVEQGIRNAVAAAGPGLGGIRIDSGNLLELIPRARRLLDELGARQTRIVATGGLDEYAMEELDSTPVDAFGAGERLVYPASGDSSPGFVYKLVAIAESDEPGARLRSVAKRSVGKASPGGRKWAYRILDEEGRGRIEQVAIGERPAEPPGARPLQRQWIAAGRQVLTQSVDEARRHHQMVRRELTPEQLSIQAGGPALSAVYVPSGDPLQAPYP